MIFCFRRISTLGHILRLTMEFKSTWILWVYIIYISNIKYLSALVYKINTFLKFLLNIFLNAPLLVYIWAIYYFAWSCTWNHFCYTWTELSKFLPHDPHLLLLGSSRALCAAIPGPCRFFRTKWVSNIRAEFQGIPRPCFKN